MTSREDLIKEWIELADHDLGTAKIILERVPEYKEIIGFHCQQSVEKYLKALLTYNEIEFAKTHDLQFLIYMLNEKVERIKIVLKDKADLLTSFAVDVRYPLGRFQFHKTEMEKLVSIADEFRKEIISQLNLK